MGSLILPLTCLCTPTIPGMSYLSYPSLESLVLLVRQLSPIFLCQELGLGLGQVAGGVTGEGGAG